MGDYDVIERVNMIHDAIEAAKQVILSVADDSRETSIAMTKLDEARLWGQEAVAAPMSAVHVIKH